ncbi:MAG: hypothetical protein ACOZNI_29175 [Myxococcota bacterium]
MNAATTTTLLLLAGWLVVGGFTAAALARRGHPMATVACAVPAWPVLLSLFEQAGGKRGAGPYASRIAAAFAALAETMRDPAATEVVDPDTLGRVREALDRADARVALVDRMLADESLRGDAAAARLADARARAAGQIEEILRGVVQLRVQVGLVALAGDVAPARERLGELAARVHALEELTLA